MEGLVLKDNCPVMTTKELAWRERLEKDRNLLLSPLNIIGDIAPDGWEYRWVNIAKTINDPYSKVVDDYADDGWNIVPYWRHKGLLDYFKWKKAKRIPWISCGLSILVERRIPKGNPGYVELESSETIYLTSREIV